MTSKQDEGGAAFLEALSCSYVAEPFDPKAIGGKGCPDHGLFIHVSSKEDITHACTVAGHYVGESLDLGVVHNSLVYAPEFSPGENPECVGLLAGSPGNRSVMFTARTGDKP